MSRFTNSPPTNMIRICLSVYLHCLLGIGVVAQVTFDKPPSGGATVTIAEDKVVGSTIYTLQATDPSGNVPAFTILTQNPSTPVFSVDANDNLIVPSQGLDAETATQFTFTFRVTAGSSTADSGVLTVNVTDVNDNDPVFQNTPYTGEVWKNDQAGATITTVTASDPDISDLPITYSIAGAQTTFSVNMSGVISLFNTAGLASLSSPTVLQVQASDGGRTGTASVTITIHDNPCSPTPCLNGGTCNSDRSTYTCTCLSGYEGDRCQSVDYCYQGPCQNGGTCINAATGYTCSCTATYSGQNCTTMITTPSTTTTTTTPTKTTTPTTTSATGTTVTSTRTSSISSNPAMTPTTPTTPQPCVCRSRSDSVDVGLIVSIVVIVLCCLCPVVLFVILKKQVNAVDETDANKTVEDKTDGEQITLNPQIQTKDYATQAVNV